MTEFVEELNRELNGRQLDIWRGVDADGNAVLTPDQCEAYRRIWRRQAKTEGVRQPCNCGKDSPSPPPLPR